MACFPGNEMLKSSCSGNTVKEGSSVTKEEAFEFLDRTARGIAEMFGASCETLVQDMGSPNHPILSIYNGQVSGREVGSTLDIMGSGKSLDATALTTDFVNLYATTPSGSQIKSSTFHLMGEGYNLALGIDFDFTSLAFANRTLMGLMNADADLQSAIWTGGEGQLGQIFEECLASLGKPSDELSKRDRMHLIALLDQKNAFSFRKSVPYVAARLKVSRYTIYKYLGELSQEKAAARKE